MTATFAHPSLHDTSVRVPHTSLGERAARTWVRPTVRRRGRRLGVCEAWRLLSDDLPSFGDDD